MATYNTLTDLLKAIANAIRDKKETTTQINAQNFPTEIASIPKASGSISINSKGTHNVTNYAVANVNVPVPSLSVSCGYHHSPYQNGPSTVLNLGSSRTVKAYAFGGSSWNGGSCKIQYSSNNSNWTTLDSGTMPALKTNNDTFSKGGNTNISAQYWRCITGEGDSNGSDGWISITYI